MSKRKLEFFRSSYLQKLRKRDIFHRLSSAIIIACTLSSCVANNGIAEFQTYRSAYTSSIEAGQSILDRFAIAELEIHGLMSPKISTTSVSFDPNQSAYYSNAVDPPATAAFRRSLQAVQAYNEALYGLASGQTAEAIAANISDLSAIGASAAGEVGGVAAAIVPGAAVGVAAFTTAATAVNGVVKTLEPLNTFALGFKTRDEFRKRLLAEATTIDDILETTRNNSSNVFDALLAKTVHNATSFERGNKGFTADEIKKIEQTRELMSNWVVLLDGTRLALNRAVLASQDTSGSISITGLIVTGTELESAARAVRKNLAETAN